LRKNHQRVDVLVVALDGEQGKNIARFVADRPQLVEASFGEAQGEGAFGALTAVQRKGVLQPVAPRNFLESCEMACSLSMATGSSSRNWSQVSGSGLSLPTVTVISMARRGKRGCG
jgi:hypothetical protein